ncbi:hypothetical protein F4813DRAFT_392640 [Daldinia decipiens]|uniref:uncharacterized protein n=1 Tax=Daldinia decipiens TaxID=326647 RepID=UPI0020C2B710|nr:uncharacterized protein F4813DRAFT_392640 [Daldinia decipiens]KAI1654392.1 hypothetical protein F4813DRAFT_392640 [Daldinia decipiens]
MPYLKDRGLTCFPVRRTEIPEPTSFTSSSDTTLPNPLYLCQFPPSEPTASFLTIIRSEPVASIAQPTPAAITPSSPIWVTPIGTTGLPRPTFFPPSATPPNTVIIIIVAFSGALGLIITFCIAFACYRSMKRRQQQNTSEESNDQPTVNENTAAPQENKQNNNNSLEGNEHGVSPFRPPSNHANQRATAGQHSGASLGTSSGSTMHAGRA